MAIKFYVGNLPYNVNEEELKKFFEAYGVVISSSSNAVTIPRDRDRGHNRGFGFVEIETENPQEIIDKIDGKVLGERKIRVAKADDDKSKGNNRSRSGHRGFRSRGDFNSRG
jgi:RNA recognition motif-containing protein